MPIGGLLSTINRMSTSKVTLILIYTPYSGNSAKFDNGFSTDMYRYLNCRYQSTVPICFFIKLSIVNIGIGW